MTPVLLNREIGPRHFVSAIALALNNNAKLTEEFTIFSFPQDHWKKLRTNNLAERVSKEIKR